MNANTKLALQNLATAIQQLATGTVHMLGSESTAEIINAAEELKSCLDKDETIP